MTEVDTGLYKHENCIANHPSLFANTQLSIALFFGGKGTSLLHLAVTNQSNWGTSFPHNNHGDGIDDNNSSAAQLLLSLGADKDELTGEQEMVPEPRLRAQRKLLVSTC